MPKQPSSQQNGIVLCNQTGTATGVAILAAGTGWLAVDKPAGVSVHNEPGADLVSLVQDRLLSDETLATQLGYGRDGSVKAAHRLDRDTSGIVVLTCADEALRWIANQFQQGRVGKQYAALVHGKFGPPDNQGRWTWPLSRQAGGRTDPAGPPPKLACATDYRVLDQSRHYSLLACQPVTGRRHQIRRHACLAGHPVVGDRRYAPQRALRHLARIGFTGLALHARRLTFQPPGHSEPIHIATTGLPAAMMELLEADRG